MKLLFNKNDLFNNIFIVSIIKENAFQNIILIDSILFYY